MRVALIARNQCAGRHRRFQMREEAGSLPATEFHFFRITPLPLLPLRNDLYAVIFELFLGLVRNCAVGKINDF